MATYLTIRDRKEEELDKRVQEKIDREGFQFIKKRKVYQENTGNLWYAKLKKV